MVLDQGLYPEPRPVQLDPRTADRSLEALRPTHAPAAMYFTRMSGRRRLHDANYLRDTAMQAGLATEYIEVERIGWNCAATAVRR